MVLRPADIKDESTLFKIHTDVFKSHIENIWGWNDEWQRSRFKQETNSCRTTVVELDGRIVGYTQVREEPHQTYLQNIALCPDVQGRGIGRDLVKQLQSKASDRNVPLALSVFRTNDRALRFYESLGFRRTGQSEAQIEMCWRAD